MYTHNKVLCAYVRACKIEQQADPSQGVQMVDGKTQF